MLLAVLIAAGPAVADDAESGRIPLQTVVPVYPESARRDRLEGEVQVCFHVDRDGRPYRVAVRTSTHRVFERPSIEAVRASTYAPLDPGVKLPAIKTCRTFRFRLTSVESYRAAARLRMRVAASARVAPTLTSPSSWPAMTATPVAGKSDSRQRRSNSRAMAGVP